MDNQHTLIKGYRDLSKDEIDQMNKIKDLAEQVGNLIEGMEAAANLPGGLEPDKRWLELGRTHLQQGFMALTRSIAKPTSF